MQLITFIVCGGGNYASGTIRLNYKELKAEMI